MLVGGALPVGRGGENSQVGASEEVTERIMAHLQKERYLDAARFAGFMCATSTVSISGGG